MSDFKVHENTQLLVQFRDNILAIINAMEAMGGVMAQMPQLPVRWAGGGPGTCVCVCVPGGVATLGPRRGLARRVARHGACERGGRGAAVLGVDARLA